MKIGVFDSGLGGLLVTKALITELPEYDYVYLGDTKRVPYGNRSQETVYQFTKEAVDFLFAQNCQLIIIACNTASAEALRTVQQDLVRRDDGRQVLGVIFPTAEATHKSKRIGILATASTVHSETYIREIQKVNSQAEIIQKSAPLLVPMIEHGGIKWIDPVLREYIQSLGEIDTLILGCTHYVRVKQMVRDIVGDSVRVLSQDELIPESLRSYLSRHSDIEKSLQKNYQRTYLVTDLTEGMQEIEQSLLGETINLELVTI